MDKNRKGIIIGIVLVLILGAGCALWILRGKASSDFPAPKMEAYGEKENYYYLSEDYSLDGKLVLKEGYYEAVKLLDNSDFRIYVPIDPETFERLPSENFSDGTIMEIEGKTYEIHVKDNQYTATEK